jgi:hypothetical protein
MPALKLKSLSESLSCGISPSKLKATTRWAPFSHALKPALKLISSGERLSCGISHNKLEATSR